MAIWKATTVAAMPQILLSSYVLFRTELNQVHLFGWNLTEEEGRVSSPLMSFNRAQRIAETRPGRCYKLVCEPGVDRDAMNVLDRWCTIFRVQLRLWELAAMKQAIRRYIKAAAKPGARSVHSRGIGRHRG